MEVKRKESRRRDRVIMWFCGLRLGKGNKKAKYSSVSYSSSGVYTFETSPSVPIASTSERAGETEILSPSLNSASKYGTQGGSAASSGPAPMSTPPEGNHRPAQNGGHAPDHAPAGVAERIKDGADRLLLASGASAQGGARDVLVFDAARHVLYSNLPALDVGELPAVASAFADRGKAMMRGITLCGVRYEVHRYHPPLVYGRTAVLEGPGREQESVGIALCKTEAANGEMTVFALITYAMPALSARMVPQLKRFCKEVVEPLQQWNKIS